MIIYRGAKVKEGGHQPVIKEINGEIMAFRSADGFQWGYDGSGPSKLGFALILDASGDKDIASMLHGDFTYECVRIFGDNWAVSQSEIMDWINQKLKAPDMATWYSQLKEDRERFGE